MGNCKTAKHHKYAPRHMDRHCEERKRRGNHNDDSDAFGFQVLAVADSTPSWQG